VKQVAVVLGVSIDSETGKVVPLGGSFEGEGGVSTAITLGASVYPKPETRIRNTEPETRNPKLEIRNPKPETRNTKHSTRN